MDEATPNVAAVQRDLAALGDDKLAKSGLAQVALTLAAGLDSDSSLTSKAMASKTLADTLGELRAMAPEKKEQDGVDDLAAQRDKRRKGKAAAAG